MCEKDLHDAKVHPILQEARRKAVAQAVGPKEFIEAAGAAGRIESQASGLAGDGRGIRCLGEDPLGVSVEPPGLSQHVKGLVGEGKGALLVALADDMKEHSFGVDRRDGEGDGLADPKTAGVDQRETGAVERLADRTDQAAAVGIAAKVGKAFAKGQAYFFSSEGASRRIAYSRGGT